MKHNFAVFSSLLVTWALATCVFEDTASAMSISLTPSSPSPAMVGDIVTWYTATADANTGRLRYRFRVKIGTGAFQTVHDFSPLTSLNWAMSEHEGSYEVEASVNNLDTGESASTSEAYQITSRVSGSQPVLTSTANPLVALYSAPACAAGSQMFVAFTSGDGFVQNTSRKSCTAGVSMNFYLGGMRASTQYSVYQTVVTGTQTQNGPTLTWITQPVSLSLAPYTVLTPPQKPVTQGILLQSMLFEMTVATDLQGNLVWYYPGNISSLIRPETGGLFLGLLESPTEDQSHQLLREFDLAGNTTLETNAERIDIQLAAMGKRQISGFHHEARRLPNGRIMVLGDVEQVLLDTQGPGPVDVLGDMILVLDRNLQVVWTWDAFDYLNVRRPATLGETCTPAGGGCPAFYLMPQANDWLHGNSLQLASDGSILYSARHQDWLIKIAYGNGLGSGNIIWRLGQDGDFAINSSDPNPWFSHQHDASLSGPLDATVLLFDDGNVRRVNDPNAHSRGQVLLLDEVNRVATPTLNVDLGEYSYALGSAQKLTNGDYHFDAGYINTDNLGNRSQSIEVDASGKTIYRMQIAGPAYRTFRMRDLYTP
jgi:arylsulfate sulfotransferase